MKIDTIRFTTGTEAKPVGRGRVELAVDAKTATLTQRRHGTVRRWTGSLVDAAWNRMQELLVEARFPQPVTVTRNVPGMDSTEILCTSNGIEERVMFIDSPGPYLAFQKLVSSLLAQLAPDAMSKPPWEAPLLIEDVHEH